MIINRDAADDDRASGLDAFCYLDGHHSAEGQADEDKRFGAVYLFGETEGVVGEGLFLKGVDPMDIGGGKTFGQPDVGK